MAALSATRAVGLPARSGELLRLPVARASLLTWLARPTCLPDLLLATKCRRDQRRPWALAVRRRLSAQHGGLPAYLLAGMMLLSCLG